MATKTSRPDHPAIAHQLYRQGVAYLIDGKSKQSRTLLHAAFLLVPEDPQILNSLGSVYFTLGEIDRAEELIARAIHLNPGNHHARSNLGSVMAKQGKAFAAEECFLAALELQPQDAATLCNLGITRRSLRKWTEAEEAFRRAIGLAPNEVRPREELCKLLLHRDRGCEAGDELRGLLAADGANAWAERMLGDLARRSNRPQEAICHYDRALSVSPEDAEAGWNRALCHLAIGDYPAGWADYDRWGIAGGSPPKRRHRSVPLPQWDGGPLADKTLLVHAEQGIGDEIMFAGCIPDLAPACGQVVIQCDPRLVPLFSRSFPFARVVGNRGDDENGLQSLCAQHGVGVQLPVGSLPRHLRQSAAQFPSQRGYLAACPEKTAAWREKLQALGTSMKIGVSWRGGASRRAREERSIPLAEWGDILGLADACFVSLQYGEHSKEIAAAARQHPGLVVFEELDLKEDMDGLAALITSLDMVVTVDNSTAHLAGAVGASVWTLLPPSSDWRWRTEGSETPWYPSMVLYRRNSEQDWRSLLARVGGDLRSLRGCEPAPRPTSNPQRGTYLHDPAAEISREKQKYDSVWGFDGYRGLSPGEAAAHRHHLVRRLEKAGVRTILDAGCGSGKLMKKLMTEDGSRFIVHGLDISEGCLDPFFDECKEEVLHLGCLWEAKDFPGRYDAVLCTDVLEHIPTKHVPAVLDNLYSAATKFCYLAIALFPDHYGPAVLGEQLHLTLEDPEWWMDQVERTGARVSEAILDTDGAGDPTWLHLFIHKELESTERGRRPISYQASGEDRTPSAFLDSAADLAGSALAIPAAVVLTSGLAEHPGNVDLLAGLAELLAVRGDFPDSLASPAGDGAPTAADWDHVLLYALGLLADGRPSEALAQAERVALESPEHAAAALLVIGDAYAAIGASDAAGEAYNEACTRAPDSQLIRRRLDAT